MNPSPLPSSHSLSDLSTMMDACSAGGKRRTSSQRATQTPFQKQPGTRTGPGSDRFVPDPFRLVPDQNRLRPDHNRLRPKPLQLRPAVSGHRALHSSPVGRVFPRGCHQKENLLTSSQTGGPASRCLVEGMPGRGGQGWPWGCCVGRRIPQCCCGT